MSYPCTKCGLCCKNIKSVIALHEYHSGDGVCKFYVESEGCSIYEQRPIYCRIDEGYKELFSKVITLKEYYKKNAEVCNQLQEENKLDVYYRVNL
ncbi:YkgJ family cysteine cluster protein [Vibrio sp. Vb1018]|uniref:YkgJ family cysteine cluster protein n=1 Tax=Vibrio sp. Vb1018 TaxID=3074636 RepID=UPI0029647DED|nr:YkgJ family cysteine cluster protein [Vibrio sp. Vb1018]MDW1821580.1 YkgJ family cysteine cluster protein [Vibrio sp. Vb1018]